MKTALLLLLLASAAWGQTKQKPCTPVGESGYPHWCKVGWEAVYEPIGSVCEGLSAPLPIILHLSNVTIPQGIRYCDQVSGKDAGAECVMRKGQYVQIQKEKKIAAEQYTVCENLSYEAFVALGECALNSRTAKVLGKDGLAIHYDLLPPSEACPSGRHWKKGNSEIDSLASCKDSSGICFGPMYLGRPSDYDYYTCERNKP